jgi:cobalt-zinc-cadmium efflux system membrane fusion protein
MMKVLLYTIFATLFLQGCKENSPEETSSVSTGTEETMVTLSMESEKNAGITTGLASYEKLPTLIKVNGLVDVPPQSLVSISFPYGGYLKKTELLPGRPVKKGEVIALMEDQSYVQLQQDYLQAIARVNLLKLDYQRQLELREGDASSKRTFENAKTELEIQQVLVKGLSEKLMILGVSPQHLTIENISRTVPVRSPITGFVKSVFVNVGKYVNPSDVLFEIVDPDHIHGSLTVFEKDQHLVKQGQKLDIFTSAHPDKPYRGEVILVSKDVDSNRGVTVHCHFTSNHSDLIPGMYISATIQTESQLLPLVPESAIVRYNSKHYVFTVQDSGKYRMAEVTLGESHDGKVALTANYLDWSKQQIVLTGAYALLGKLKNVEEE